MKLLNLLEPILHKQLTHIDNLEEIDIVAITSDSRKVEQGSLFACVPGHTVDGHDFAEDAINKGAVAILTERILNLQIPQVVVPNVAKVLPLLANFFYDHPTKNLKLIGVTGTNGKTTTTYLVETIMKNAGLKTGVIGTIEMRIGDEIFPVENTTPEPITLQQSFKEMVDKEVDVAIIEVSSHALELARVAGCDFNIAAFTNLTQDHLDFHKTLDAYLQAKAKLFSRLGNTYDHTKYAVLNVDDVAYKAFESATVMQILTYGIDNDADVKACNLIIRPEGVSFDVVTPFGDSSIKLKMTGKFSVYNALTAISICLLEGVPLESIKNSLESVPGVPGRFEKVDVGQNFTVIVDYAHTADSLENVLKTIQEFAERRIITVFGCGGDRDRTKRPLMGEVSKKYSDLSIITSDNPRTEDLHQIIDDIMVVYEDASNESYIRIDDRKAAIEHAVNIAEQGDVVLIAGKGHETYQIIGKQKFDFDDRIIAADAMRNL